MTIWFVLFENCASSWQRSVHLCDRLPTHRTNESVRWHFSGNLSLLVSICDTHHPDVWRWPRFLFAYTIYPGQLPDTLPEARHSSRSRPDVQRETAMPGIAPDERDTPHICRFPKNCTAHSPSSGSRFRHHLPYSRHCKIHRASTQDTWRFPRYFGASCTHRRNPHESCSRRRSRYIRISTHLYKIHSCS